MRRAELGEPDDMPAMRHLLVLIDEFGELLSAKPEFIDLFLRIGRIGRSIGVHLLLASQRVEEGKLRGLETYLSYRIGLRTLTETESRTVLDSVDAFHLPPLPGNGYLKVDVTIYQRFKAAYVSRPLADDTDAELAPITGPAVRPMPLFGSAAPVGDGPRERPVRRTTGPTLLSAVAAQMAVRGNRVPPVWLPTLPVAVTLDQACGGFDVTPRGVRLNGGAPAGPGLTIPLGLLDDPARQWQGPWLVDLSAGGGHFLVTGGPGTGKTTALCTLALGLAGTRTPDEVGIYGVDLLGSGLRALSGLPHVGGVAGRADRERVRRTLDEVHAMLSQRERVFARHSIDTVHDLRGGRATNTVREEIGCTDVVLLIDGYGQLSAEFVAAESRVHDLLARGGRYGIHVVASARRWNEVRGAQQVSFAHRVELRLTEPAESSIDGKLARGVPVNQPGRALAATKLYAQVALPRLDGLPDPGTSGLSAAATMIRGAWTGPLPPPVRVLPAVLPATSLPDPAGGTVPLGRFEDDFSVATLDLFGADQHLLVLGDSGMGRTNLLRLVAGGLMRQYGPDDLVFAVFDPRRRLADLVPEPYRGGYATNPALAQQLTTAVCKELAQRDPSSGGAGGQPKPRVVLLVDDYDILSASGSQPLGGFAPYVGAGRDIGFHVVMTRRVAGASRGLFEPFTLAVRESGCPGLLMSGDRTEGQLFAGVRPTTLPVGRALCVRPGEPARTVQTAYVDGEQAS
jgi:S-DNA-T family DNA segregation ATPase FtsK/SpoIIIE